MSTQETIRTIRIFDTTLRDGEQSPGCSMNLSEKLKIAHQLGQLKVDTIEAGFAVISRGDFSAVHEIAKEVKGVQIASLSRARTEDIDAAREALAPAEEPLIHVFLATSPLHMQYKLKMTEEEVLGAVSYHISYARRFFPLVEFSAEDAFRSDRTFLKKVLSAAIEAGAGIVNIPDTVGYATPHEMYTLIQEIRSGVEGIDRAKISVHCHNDLGMAVANSLASIEAGAEQIECTITGIGERAGNAALEEIVMAIKTREHFFKARTNVNTKELVRSANKLSRIIGIQIPPNKPIIGGNAFSHEAGIHQHGVMENRETYEIMTPESIGVPKNNMVLGKHSGKHAFEERLRELGYSIRSDIAEELFKQFKALSDKKKTITDFDIEALVESHSATEKHYRLVDFVINSGNNIRATAIVRLKNIAGEILEEVAVGSGPVYASFTAIDKMVNLGLKLEDYAIRSVTEGEDALGQVSVKVSGRGKTVTGRGLSPDVLESSILAYIHAINKILSSGEDV